MSGLLEKVVKNQILKELFCMPCKEVLLVDFSNVDSGESWKRFSQSITHLDQFMFSIFNDLHIWHS